MSGFAITIIVLIMCVTCIICILGWKCIDERDYFFYHTRLNKIEDRLSELEKNMKGSDE